MFGRQLETSLYAGLLFTVLGLTAWGSGERFIFPSLGPSAFVLAFEQRGESPEASRIVGGHLIGGLVGLLAYTILAGDVSLTATPPAFSAAGLRLTLSAVVSMILTSWGMLATDSGPRPRVCDDPHRLAGAALDADPGRDHRRERRYLGGGPQRGATGGRPPHR